MEPIYRLKKKNIITLEGDPYLLTIPHFPNLEKMTTEYGVGTLFQESLVQSWFCRPDREPTRMVHAYETLINTGKYRNQERNKIGWYVEPSPQWYSPCLVPVSGQKLSITPPMAMDGEVAEYGRLVLDTHKKSLSDQPQELMAFDFRILDEEAPGEAIQWMWCGGCMHAINVRLWLPEKLYRTLV